MHQILFEIKCKNISIEHFEKLNWLPINERFKQSVTSTVFKFVQNLCPAYKNGVFIQAENIRINMRNSYLKLNHPLQKPVPDKTDLYWT